MNQLLLASGSPTRKYLLEEIGIQVRVVPHEFDETIACDWALPLVQLAESIACSKMDNVSNDVLDHDQDIEFIVTADTLCQDKHGTLYGKPRDREDAKAMIKAKREGARVATAFCLEKRKQENNMWNVMKRLSKVVTTTYSLDIPDHWIDIYLDQEPDFRGIGGALDIQGYGGQFLKEIDGSFSALAGLPLYELRLALEKLNFYSKEL